MVLQGGAAPQVVLSIPVEGLTVTAAEADTRQAQPRIEAHTSAAARQYAARGGMNTESARGGRGRSVDEGGCTAERDEGVGQNDGCQTLLKGRGGAADWGCGRCAVGAKEASARP